jgi:hypothetical protein
MRPPPMPKTTPRSAPVPAGGREDEEEQHERQRQPVVQPRFEVERVPHPRRHALRRHYRGGDDRVGGRKDGGEQERLSPAQLREQGEGDQRQGPQGERHREHDRAGGRPPVHGEQLPVDDEAVGEQREDQGQLHQVHQVRVAGVDLDHVGDPEDPPDGDGQHRDGQDRAAHDPREPGRDREQEPEDQERFGEPELHERRLCACGGA